MSEEFNFYCDENDEFILICTTKDKCCICDETLINNNCILHIFSFNIEHCICFTCMTDKLINCPICNLNIIQLTKDQINALIKLPINYKNLLN